MTLLREHILLPGATGGHANYFGSASVPVDAGSNSLATVTITPPASMKAGDLVFVVAAGRSSTNSPIVIGGSDGQSWSTIEDFVDFGGAGISIKTAWCQFNGTWSVNPDFSFPGLVVSRSVVMHVFRPTSKRFVSWGFETSGTLGNDQLNPIQNAGSILTGHAITLTIAVWYHSAVDAWTNFTGTGWVDFGAAQYRNTAGADQSFTFAYKTLRGAASTGQCQKDMSTGTGPFGYQKQHAFYMNII